LTKLLIFVNLINHKELADKNRLVFMDFGETVRKKVKEGSWARKIH
jgi:hypothetical protein